jgi:hypothetical protein
MSRRARRWSQCFHVPLRKASFPGLSGDFVQPERELRRHHSAALRRVTTPSRQNLEDVVVMLLEDGDGSYFRLDMNEPSVVLQPQARDCPRTASGH